MKIEGYFFSLNDDDPIRALSDCDELYDTADDAKDGAELERSQGLFVDDSATVHVWKYLQTFEKVEPKSE